jgi:hypothetical protein
MTRWIRMDCSEEANTLQQRHPGAFLLECAIARRARWKDCNITGLKTGEAQIGDWKNVGLSSETAYRTAKKVLEKSGQATFRATNKGTIATLTASSIFSVSLREIDEQKDTLTTSNRRAKSGQETTNHKDRGHKETPLLFSRLDAEELSILPDGWEKLSKEDRKLAKVGKKTARMATIGKFFGRGEKSGWRVSEIITLAKLDPDPEEVDLLSYFYALPRNPDDPGFHRTSLGTLFNNWAGEVDKAMSWFADRPGDLEIAKSLFIPPAP